MADFQPCPDEQCVGVIGEDGSCTICGSTAAELSASADLDGRLPCRDGNCLGVAGPDGNCTECGAFVGDPAEGDTAEVDVDRERRPCPNGSCIGVIGDDGFCSECREPIKDDVFDTGSEDEEWATETYGDDDETGDEDDDENDDDRSPCPDGACIGIVGDDGLCTECGRSPDEVE